MQQKICNKCGLQKEIEEFRLKKDKNGKYYRYSYCKNCEKQKNRLYLKEYTQRKKEKLKEYRDEYYIKNKENKIEYQKEYYQHHKEEKRKYDKNYRKINKTKRNKRENELYKNDKLYKLKKQLRNCIYRSFTKKSFYKKEHTNNIIGCDYDFFVKYLLNTYKEKYGFEWDGIEKVHIDHIIPLYVAKEEQDVIKLCHYTNLQLLKAEDNLKKSNKLNYNGGDY